MDIFTAIGFLFVLCIAFNVFALIITLFRMSIAQSKLATMRHESKWVGRFDSKGNEITEGIENE